MVLAALLLFVIVLLFSFIIFLFCKRLIYKLNRRVLARNLALIKNGKYLADYKNLSENVPNLLQQAANVKETHSYGGAPCTMPQAVKLLGDAISVINNELLRYKCDLKIGDYVILASLEQTDSYVLIDKLHNEV